MSADVSRVPGKTRVWQCVFCDTNNRLDVAVCRNCDATPATGDGASPIADDIPQAVIDEAWVEYVYPRAAVGELSHPHPQGGFIRAMRVVKSWAAKQRAEGVSVGCAGTPGAHVADEQTTVHAVSTVDAVTDDMVERAARSHAELEGYDWDWPTIDTYIDREQHRKTARAVLSAALAGYTVVRLPAPAGGADEGCTVWELDNEVEDQVDEVHAFVEDSQPYVTFMLTDTNPDQAERLAGVLLAAAREARRLAGGSQVGDQHGE